MKSENSRTLGDVLIGFNIAGIGIVMIASIFVRRMLTGMQIELDKDETTPSDFGIVVRNIPLDMTKEDLKLKL